MITTEFFDTQMEYIEAVHNMMLPVEEVVSEDVKEDDEQETEDETNEVNEIIEDDENEVVE